MSAEGCVAHSREAVLTVTPQHWYVKADAAVGGNGQSWNKPLRTLQELFTNAQFAACDFTVVYDYLGDGYGIVGDLEREAIRLLASREGIVVDPVYTGRAMGALLDLIRKKAFRSDETVLFWHTGGAPALFAYAKDLTPDISYRSAGSRAAPSE